MIKIMVMLLMTNLYANSNNLTEESVICSFPKSELLKFIRNGVYRPKSLEGEGFIHCCKPSQITYVANKFFIEDEQILLISSSSVLGNKLIYEGEREFPHLYRELKVEDLLDILILKRDSQTGEFDLFEVLNERN